MPHSSSSDGRAHGLLVINEDIYVELLELLELYCELLIARFGLLDQKLVRTSLAPHQSRSFSVHAVPVSLIPELARACAQSSTPHQGQNSRVSRSSRVPLYPYSAIVQSYTSSGTSSCTSMGASSRWL